ncbi:hypothetical protein [Luteimonas suaedae]|uniref:hypothetical protein n=1 Tax=Luteimonas suaedae TaxID=2605430 RepID=UPI0011EF840B|nr:hypothetical protein [Luteimonas suaedae]
MGIKLHGSKQCRSAPCARCRGHFAARQIPVTGAPAGPESRHPPDPAGIRGIARMARSYGEAGHQWTSLQCPEKTTAMLQCTWRRAWPFVYG